MPPKKANSELPKLQNDVRIANVVCWVVLHLRSMRLTVR